MGTAGLYQALRRAMVTAVESKPGTDPDRAGFTTALETAKDLLIKAENIIDDSTDPIGAIGRAVLADLSTPIHRPEGLIGQRSHRPHPGDRLDGERDVQALGDPHELRRRVYRVRKCLPVLGVGSIEITFDIAGDNRGD